VWIKQNRSGEGLFTGMGWWTRSNAEMCLLATKGSPTRLSMDVHQIILAPVDEHSVKPEEVQNHGRGGRKPAARLAEVAANVTQVLADLILMAPPDEQTMLLADVLANLGGMLVQKSEEDGDPASPRRRH
jgi:hypothetical protein